MKHEIPLRRVGGLSAVFDIVNGFLNRCRGAWRSIFGLSCKAEVESGGNAALTDVNLAEIILHTIFERQVFMQACR